MLKELPKVEKILGLIQTNENFVLGNELSIGDIIVLMLFYIAEDKWFKAEFSNPLIYRWLLQWQEFVGFWP